MKKVHFIYFLDIILVIVYFYVASLIPFEEHVWLLIPFLCIACTTIMLPSIYLQRHPVKAQLPNDYVSNEDETIQFNNQFNKKYTTEEVVKGLTLAFFLVTPCYFFKVEEINWSNFLGDLSTFLFLGIIFMPIYVSRIRKQLQSYYIVQEDLLIIRNDRIAGDMNIPLEAITDVRFEFNVYKSAYNPFLLLTINGLPLKLETYGCGMQLAYAILYRQKSLQTF